VVVAMMTRISGVLGLLVLAFALAGCQSGDVSRSAVQTTTTLSVPDTTLPIQSGDVRIGPMDLLDISVFGAPDLDNSYQVDFEGKLKLPLIGTIPAAGFTASQLATNLERRLGETYLQDPDVTVRVSEASKRFMTVDGSVQKPGMYPVEGQLTLLQAIALSGGPSDNANTRRVVVFRQIEGKRHAAGFDLKEIRQGNAEDPIVYANDIIVVDGSEARRTYGDFLRSVPLLALFFIY
jgi:polysaccharide export outer membrane protein